jgi:adenylate cyclase class IV
MNTEENLPKFTELETKYRVDGDQIYKFKEIVEGLPDYEFLYVQGSDYYFVRDDQKFARYRKADGDKSGRAEVTFKLKPVGAKNNIARKEYNWRVDKTPMQEISEGLEDQGYKFNFKIFKKLIRIINT